MSKLHLIRGVAYATVQFVPFQSYLAIRLFCQDFQKQIPLRAHFIEERETSEKGTKA